jgi:hypothetical protein
LSSNLPSSSTITTTLLNSSPHKRLRKARRSEITPQKRKKMIETTATTNGIANKRAKRGIKLEKVNKI